MAPTRSLPPTASLVLLIVMLACTAATAISLSPNARLIGWVVSDYSDRKGLHCEQLPTAERVRQVLDEHQAEWRQVRKHSDWVEVDTERCPGKADLAIYYPTDRDRTRIKRLIGESFFGIPYRMFLV